MADGELEVSQQTPTLPSFVVDILKIRSASDGNLRKTKIIYEKLASIAGKSEKLVKVSPRAHQKLSGLYNDGHRYATMLVDYCDRFLHHLAKGTYGVTIHVRPYEDEAPEAGPRRKKAKVKTERAPSPAPSADAPSPAQLIRSNIGRGGYQGPQHGYDDSGQYGSPASHPVSAGGEYIVPSNEKVAAYVKMKGEKKQWILARVVRFLPEKGKYEVADDEPGDEQETPTKKMYVVHPKYMMPLPGENDDVDTVRPMEKDELVMAMFPDTTVFYKAIVIAPPSRKVRKGVTPEYTVQFEDDEDDNNVPINRKVPFRYVLPNGGGVSWLFDRR